MKRLILIVICMVLFSATPAHPFWIWTPKSKKFVNPKHAPRSSPSEQFDYAKGLYEGKDYKEARVEFIRLMQKYPKSFEASESQYYLGLIEEAQGRLYEAYLAYQKVIDKYPFSERIQEIIEREYEIAESFIEGKKRRALGINLPVENPAIEILSRVIENSTYGSLAPKAQYKLGLVLKSLLRYYEAEEAFEKVVSNYPDSEWVGAAKFQIASCRAAVSRGPDYDQEAVREAKKQFEEFVIEHPDAQLSDKALENIGQLEDKEAQSSYEIGRFYEKQRAWESARMYYQGVIDDAPESIWAIKSLERLQAMEKIK
ncbi:tetratricopeptide repeat protein [Candidatus Omnitrophota bacterium]